MTREGFSLQVVSFGDECRVGVGGRVTERTVVHVVDAVRRVIPLTEYRTIVLDLRGAELDEQAIAELASCSRQCAAANKTLLLRLDDLGHATLRRARFDEHLRPLPDE